jgi:hypothetical protein
VEVEEADTASSKVATASRVVTVANREATAVDKAEAMEVSKAVTAANRATVSSCSTSTQPRIKLTLLTGYGGGGNNWRGAPGGGYQGEQGTHCIFARE